MAKTIDMDEVKRRAEQCGSNFFDPGTMRFFRSRAPKSAFKGPGGTYFVTSEQFPGTRTSPRGRRLYTIRKLTDICQASGVIETVGEFQQFKTPEAARKFAKKLADGDEKALERVKSGEVSGLRGWKRCGG